MVYLSLRSNRNIFIQKLDCCHRRRSSLSATIWLYLLVTYITAIKHAGSRKNVVKLTSTLVLAVASLLNNVFSSIPAVPITPHPPSNPYSLDTSKMTILRLISLCQGVCVFACACVLVCVIVLRQKIKILTTL